jgi:hypothetical protein
MNNRVASLTTTFVSLALAGCGGGSPHGGPTSTSSMSSTSSTSTSAGTGGAGGAASTGGAGGFMSAKHEPFPVVKNYGGPSLTTPTIVTVTFTGYAYDTQADAFDQWVATSDWLAQAGADYGVGKGSWYGHVTLSTTPPATLDYTGFGALLDPSFADATLPDPATLTDPIYVVRFPPATTLTFFGGGACVPGQDIGGFHGEATHGATKYALAALPQCGADAMVWSGIETSSGHEIIEAAADPFPFTDTGWALLDVGDPWPLALNEEIGDLCQFIPSIVVDGHHVPRIWSNTAAMAGDPCVPAAPPPYFNASVSPSQVVSVAAGQSADFTVEAWSTAPLAPWTLQTVAYGDFNATPKLGATQIANGGTTTLTLSVPAGTPSGKAGLVLLYSIVDLKAGKYTYWPAVVQSQ